MQGEGNGKYFPERLVTRAEFATLITRALQLPSGNAKFTDLEQVHPSLRDGINRAASAGIIRGRGDNTFDPNTTITREEAVIMIDRSLKHAGILQNKLNYHS